jgi:sulfonate transport system ATP-binding protein
MGGLEISRLCKRYIINKRPVTAIKDVDLSIAPGKFVTVVGKSGCGKTTLLRLICGLEAADRGKIRITTGNGRAPQAQISIVFQEPRLMPWLTVRQNMAFALRDERDRSRAERTVDGFLHMLGLTAFADAYPRQISGGMAQRTALGRTLCFNPEVILMDEPFGALDAFSRRKLQQELVAIFLSQKKTIVFVTHDVDEAVLLGQRILVMERGRLVGDLTNDLAYPRDVLAPEFLVLRERIMRSVVAPPDFEQTDNI